MIEMQIGTIRMPLKDVKPGEFGNPFVRLTDEEQELFDFTLDAIRNNEAVGLMRVAVDGKPRAVIVYVREAPDGEFDVIPIAVLIDESSFMGIDPEPEGKP